MVEAYRKFLTNYANFNGRSTRSDYWYVFLVNLVISFGIILIGGLIPAFNGILSVVSGLFSLAVLIPEIAIIVRRLHDINKSGWFAFIALIPVAGIIILLVFLCTDSVNENNRYGNRV